MRMDAYDYATREPVTDNVLVSGGYRIKIGAEVRVSRSEWTDKIGIYQGKDRRTKKLKVQFAENGGANLLCEPFELIPVAQD
jgi:hypothetical protein